MGLEATIAAVDRERKAFLLQTKRRQAQAQRQACDHSLMAAAAAPRAQEPES
ncbi:hypothetical protein P7K49_032565 [Saguinus oedipus]|uniref:Uncharacterized protein n=1 Tax=Saguinus oedipus TaxID=9490 RepID=A0ABQ9TYK9_SAGOE|nr:hypothetical protein P7K49_032565 [Saguinus oedipus]